MLLLTSSSMHIAYCATCVLCVPMTSCVVVAGTALVLAVFLPNVELIFGLAGSTASVLIAYILPAAIFLIASRPPKQPTGTLISVSSPILISAQSAHSQLLVNEMSQPVKEAGAQQLSQSGLKGFRRKAWGLLVFGMVVAVVCTRATLTAVQQEAQVVQLAQELVASEAAVHTKYPVCCQCCGGLLFAGIVVVCYTQVVLALNSYTQKQT